MFDNQPPESLLHSSLSPNQGCFEHISHAINSYTWGISWFGFSILMWTVRGGTVGREGQGSGLGIPISLSSPQLPVMLIAMYLYTTL